MNSTDDLKKLFRQYPSLTSAGLAVPLHGISGGCYVCSPRGRVDEFNAALNAGRNELLTRVYAIRFIASWLSKCPKLKGINHKRSSYGLKHACESHILAPKHRTYVSNGEFIAAALLAGFTPYKSAERMGNLNCSFNMGERWIREQLEHKVVGCSHVDLNDFALERRESER